MPDNTTLAEFLTKIEDQYGRTGCGSWTAAIPTEQTLETMREGDAPVRCLVGAPKGRLSRLEKSFLNLPWQEVRQSIDVNLLTRDAELYVLVCSERRVLEERSMRWRRPTRRANPAPGCETRTLCAPGGEGSCDEAPHAHRERPARSGAAPRGAGPASVRPPCRRVGRRAGRTRSEAPGPAPTRPSTRRRG